MKTVRWLVRLGGAMALGAILSGCCVAPVAPYAYGPRYGGRVVYEPAPVIVAPAPAPRYRGWRHY
jgi:hypothetical protein